MKMPVTMKVVLLSLYLLFKIYIRIFKITTRTRGSFMQKEFTIQVFFCIDKARYGLITFFLLLKKSNSANNLPGEQWTTVMIKLFKTK